MNSYQMLKNAACGLGLLLGLGGCDSGSQEGAPTVGEGMRRVEHALTLDEQRTLHFEEVTDWEVWAGTGVLSSSTNVSQGLASVALDGMGYAAIRNSTVIAKDEHEAPEAVGFDIWVPEAQVDPYWAGDTQLIVDAPSAGVYQHYLG